MRLVLKFIGMAIGSSVCLLIVLGLGFGYLNYWSNQPYGESSEEIQLDIPKGVSLASLSRSLEERQLVSSSESFRLWAKIFSKFSEFKAGSYKLQPPLTPTQLSIKFIEGSSFREVKYEVSIPEGYTLKNVIDKFASQGIGSKSRFYELSTDKKFLETLNISADSIEGFLYPATYPFFELPTEEEVFRSMTEVFWKRLPAGFENIIASRGVTLYEAVYNCFIN